MSPDAEDDRVTIHVMTSSTTRNPIGSLAPLDMLVVVGFGSAVVTRNNRLLVDGETPTRSYPRREKTRAAERRSIRAQNRAAKKFVDARGFVTLRKVEKYAAKHGGEYVCSIHAPLWSASWRRERPGKWVCFEAGEGFA